MRTSAVPPVAVVRFSVEDYHRMGAAGLFTVGDRVELLEGWVSPKVVHTPRHAAAVERVIAAVAGALAGSGHRARAQLPLTLADSEPEPDVAVVVDRAYRDRHPGPTDCIAVIEVADSSIATDLGVKAAVYARAAIATYVVVDLAAARVVRHAGPVPADGTWLDRTDHRDGAIALAGVTLAVASLLGPDVG